MGMGSVMFDVVYLIYVVDFEVNILFDSFWLEGGLVFSYIGIVNDNGGCGYVGEFCVDLVVGECYSQVFLGNYFVMVGMNVYLFICMVVCDFNGIEFVVDLGYFSINLLWQIWFDGVLIGSGKVLFGDVGMGGVFGLSDVVGFDEVWVYVFDSVSDLSGYSVLVVDSVRVFLVLELGLLVLVLLVGLGLVGVWWCWC